MKVKKKLQFCVKTKTVLKTLQRFFVTKNVIFDNFFLNISQLKLEFRHFYANSATICLSLE